LFCIEEREISRTGALSSIEYQSKPAIAGWRTEFSGPRRARARHLRHIRKLQQPAMLRFCRLGLFGQNPALQDFLRWWVWLAKPVVLLCPILRHAGVSLSHFPRG
jgi:hypothetical protein